MKIADSNLFMTSSHAYESHVSAEKTTLEVSVDGNATRKLAAVYDGDGVAKSTAATVTEKRASVSAVQIDISAASTSPVGGFNIEEDLQKVKKSVLEAMLEILNGKPRKKFDPIEIGELHKGNVLDLRGSISQAAGMRAQIFGFGAVQGTLTVGTTSGGTLWKRIESESATRSESEQTTFQTQGYAVTEDGRSFQIDLALNMSRAFTESYESFRTERFVMTDPLIINLDSDITSVGDRAFEFDLDSDGQRETISFAGEGSGFLALDRNGNGVIDDGSELFGTQSGDGFADLAAYDRDGNRWIDENDDIYSELRVWTKDAQGNDKLTGLKEANVGAIYLGSAETEFSLKDADNETNGVIRKTGVYLKETGGAGTLSHVDLRC
ncbi:MAG: hypothetical protein IJR48_07740 [Oscillibacter sp.]|nr:hypothetical protein [Oscillibacter sp.]MBQ9618240.1 hypothetical protein [Oscillibacter sp.]